jgi:3D (Asp-Asp-Asp) domain-containing protein
MVVVCIVTLVNKKRSKLDSGTIMSMTEVASESKAFAGKSFNAEILTYDDMLRLESESSSDEITDVDRQRIETALSLANSASGETGKSQSVTLNERAEVVGVIEETTQAATTEAASSSSTVTTTTTSVAASPVSTPVYATADGNYQYLGEFLLTAYCACPICCGAWSNIENPTTASGAIASANHTIAVDTSVIAFGTEVLINGQVYVAEDRGSAINGNHIDIFFATHQEATNFGKQTASVYVKIAN